MEKPRLKITCRQISPALPDPCEFAQAISRAIAFIEENPDATAADLPPGLLDLLCGEKSHAGGLRQMVRQSEAIALSPDAVSSLIIFANLNLRYYREEDFADLDNFITLYDRHRALVEAIKAHSHDGSDLRCVKLFDLENVETTY